MFVLRIVDEATAPTINVDGVVVVKEIYDETKELATAAGKTHFIGVVEKRDPNFVHPFAGLSTAEFWKKWDGRKMEGMFLPVNEYVVSDDRDAVLLHGCGKLIWVLPDRSEPKTNLVEDREEYQVIKCAACNADVPITNGTTEESTAQIERGYLAAQNRRGTLTAEELAQRENIKFGIYVCHKCFMEDPDLCRFFNKIGFRVR